MLLTGKYYGVLEINATEKVHYDRMFFSVIEFLFEIRSLCGLNKNEL
jgi:hypothetical protein